MKMLIVFIGLNIAGYAIASGIDAATDLIVDYQHETGIFKENV